jgi:hypothetical protein
LAEASAAQRLSPTIRTLVVALGVPWLFYILVAPARGLVDAYLALGPGVMKGQVWQIVTALFVDRGTGLHLEPAPRRTPATGEPFRLRGVVSDATP